MALKLDKHAIGLDSKNKIRYVHIWTEWVDNKYLIHRESGLLIGKKTVAPDIEILKGKVKRTIDEQLTLEFDSNFKKYLDKGYKDVSELKLNELTEDKCKEILGDTKTDAEGVLKPMLAKKYQDVSIKLLENEWYASRKINGVRCLIFYKDGELKTRSRGATNYDVAIKHILTHPTLIDYFNKHQNLILDGEIFKFGYTLNKISGLCRKQEFDPDMCNLEFYLYDIVDTTKPFPDRLNVINQLKNDLSLSFSPEREWNDELKIQVLPQEKVSGADNIKKLHDKFVSEGWEGLVIRDLTSVYKPGQRGSMMLKYKAYQDAEYEIVGLTEGLRREDFTFLMKTPSGELFNAKPIGSREIKEGYRNNLNDMIGKMATIKYFEMSGAGTDIPQQPIWIGLRECE